MNISHAYLSETTKSNKKTKYSCISLFFYLSSFEFRFSLNRLKKNGFLAVCSFKPLNILAIIMKKCSTFLLTAIITCFFSTNLSFAQQTTGLLKGLISEPQGDPLPGVNITVQQLEGLIGTTTTSGGTFQLNLPDGDHTISFSYIGFESTEHTVSIEAGEVTEIELILNPKNNELQEIVVTENPSLTQPSLAVARAEFRTIPGGVNVTDLEMLNSKRSLTLKDAIGHEPGVIIQEFFGSNDQPRLNIRGSGIQSNPQQRGVQLLQDGVNINQADGTYVIGLLEPQAANHIEIKRGSNALEFGSATLGGAINMISKTGHNSTPLRLKLESGSFDMYNGALSGGHVFGKNDLYASVSYNQSDGFRQWNSSERLNATMNAGHKFSSNLESRVYLTFTDMSFDIPGPLNRQQLQTDAKKISAGVVPPSSIGPNVVRDQPGRTSQAFRIAQKTDYLINSKSSLEFSTRYQYLDDTFIYPITVGVKDSDSNDAGFGVAYNLNGSKHELKAGLFGSFGQIEREYFANENGRAGRQFADNTLWSANWGSFVHHRYSLTDKLRSMVGLQVVHNTRNNTDNFSTPDARPFYIAPQDQYGLFSAPALSLDQSYVAVNPKVGFMYETEAGARFYANVSRSYEPPTFDELINISGGNPNKSAEQFRAVELDAQEATTFEVGSRGAISRMNWNISLYHSRVSNELLTATDLFGISGTTRNYPDRTIHQGIEAGFSLALLRNVFGQTGDSFDLNASYTFSDFYFDEGAYKGNSIAGIPKHYIQSALEYNHPSGFFVNLNLEWLPEDTPTDHQNTLFQDGYALWGTRIGLHSARSFNVFVEGRNLLDTTYASSYLIRDVVTDPPPPALTPEDVTTFIPGSGRSFTAGICYFFN